MNSGFVVRPATPRDFEAVERLAEQALPGVFSLPADPVRLSRKIESSLSSLSADVSYPGEEDYFFVLEDLATGEVIGCAGIQATCGYRKPFYSFRHETFIHASPGLNISNKIHVLALSHDLGESSLLRSFQVASPFLNTAAAELLSLSRLLFVANHPTRFSNRLIAEIVGISDAAGQSPFWEAVGLHFYGMDYQEAERLHADDDRAYLAELLPHYPLYVNLLPDAAQHAIGQVHPGATRPYEILLEQGFEPERYVDVYDAGPTLAAEQHQIRAIRNSDLCRVHVTESPAVGNTCLLVANLSVSDFRVVLLGARTCKDGAVMLSQQEANALGCKSGDFVRISPVKQVAS
ncbi:hypothetical protein BTW15_20165 [Pseudomonas syringae pv. tomato]|uniref:Arginine N-succinyltransferase n=1 Tax=Pseudomonas syringae pv. tomato TaxID=323 RepID=A0AB36KQY4_PSEUB|nr:MULTISPECIES: arginine N-succinyltransferase [Pseudomonas]KPB81792.1 Arginine/ornithine succinyltransferase subunit alpha [Pseudomonas syringae pv. maculicola]MBI6846225.1 arginine N-succinyltransferase [Pseudomonas syringae]MBX6512130.1 arginine N-succinyltransferase [Pseudomonas syringae pv. tomato]OPE58248.1 hypothetical protein BTW15_20165 [Pseudomonas syringae pv. tomato]RMU97037.1 Arginine/ornithine succinyltransferase subunit alpha [Pseudomonas syringae pv. tomato]